MTHVAQPPRVTLPHVFARPILWAWFSCRREVTGLEGSPGAEGDLSHSQRKGRSSQSLCLELAITWCCETVTLHYLFTIDICLGRGDGISACDFYLRVLALPFSPTDFFLPFTSVVQPGRSTSTSLLLLHLSILPFFLWNVMIHWLWSPRAVSLKSVRLPSATAEWYITSITCNFLGFIRCIYSPYNGEGCSFL